MSQHDQFKELVLNEPTPKQERPKNRWLDYDEVVEVLWLDAQGEPHLTKGEYVGLEIPTALKGGPVKFVIEEPNGKVVRHTAQHVVGITPGSAGTENH